MALNTISFLSFKQMLEAVTALDGKPIDFICITETDRFSNNNYFNELANTADVTDITNNSGKDGFTNS